MDLKRPAEPEEPCDFLRMQRTLTKPVLDAFNQQGFLVIDQFFGREESDGYREEIRYLFKQKLMVSNCTATMKREDGQNALASVIVKPNIFEAELIRPEIRSLLPRLSNLYENGAEIMLEILQKHMPQLELSKDAGGATIKLQVNTGHGGCFPLHFDGPGGKKDTKRVTALLYLNPDWKREDGGCLRLYPFLQQPVDIEPLHDRLVLFFSDRVLHRVLPSQKERICFTVWFHGTSVDPAAPSAESGVEAWMSSLQQAATQRLLSHALLDSEYTASIREAHGVYAQPLLDLHAREVEALRAAPGIAAVVDYLGEFVKDKTQPVAFADYAKRPGVCSLVASDSAPTLSAAFGASGNGSSGGASWLSSSSMFGSSVAEQSRTTVSSDDAKTESKAEASAETPLEIDASTAGAANGNSKEELRTTQPIARLPLQSSASSRSTAASVASSSRPAAAAATARDSTSVPLIEEDEPALPDGVELSLF